MQTPQTRRQSPRSPRALLAVALALVGLAGCGESARHETPETTRQTRYATEIRWTGFGVPHVRATNAGSLGYGFAYATARDALCTIAYDVARVNGDLSRHLGPEDGRLASDVFHRAVLDEATIRRFIDRQSDHHAAFFEGYVAGYRRFLQDHRGSLPRACRKAPWLRELTVEDVARLTIGVSIRAGLGRFQREIANAGPPGESTAAVVTDFKQVDDAGGNAIALGRDATASGRGLLFASPQGDWQGASRFHLIHTTIPGELDVMGVSLYTTSRIEIGFNADVAWTHTGSTAVRSTLYALELEPGKPTRYRYGDDYRDMTRVELAIPTRDGTGRQRIERRSVWFTRHGPVLASDQLPWTPARAYAIRDANLANDRVSATYDALNHARSVDEVENALYLQGVAWSNTVAADRHGNAYFAGISVAPYLDAAMLDRCRLQTSGVPTHVVVLNGAEPACAWLEDPHSAIPGAMPPQRMPRLRRADFVAHAGGSHWLANPAEPLTGYPTIIGPEQTPQTLATRAGLAFIARLLAEGGRVAPEQLRALQTGHRDFSAERLLDDLLRLCAGWGHAVEVDGAPVAIWPACEVLRAWDRSAAVTSRGAHVWREFWREAQQIPDRWAVPFDPTNPSETPAGLSISQHEHREALRAALGRAVARLAAHGIALDAPLGTLQFDERDDEHIPIPGGDASGGLWSVAAAPLRAGAYTPISHGTSWTQVVGWNPDGSLDARGLLTYSQSEDPRSPHFADQTRLYAEGGWIQLPFHESEILADPNLQSLRLAE